MLLKKEIDLSNMETVVCPRCGKPFPKKRYEMGYRCCVNCSTEKPRVCIVEEVGTGEDIYTVCSIVSQEEARTYERSRQLLQGSSRTRLASLDEPELDMNTTETEEEVDNDYRSVQEAQIAEVLEANGFRETELTESLNEEESIFDVIARESHSMEQTTGGEQCQ